MVDMTEDEQPKQPPQSQPAQPESPWARGGAGLGHADAGGRQQGADQPGSDDTGAVQGGAGASEPTGAGGAWQGASARPADGTDGSAVGADRSAAGSAGVPRGNTGHPSDSYPSDSRPADSYPADLYPDSVTSTAATSNFGSPTAPHASGAEPVPGSPDAWSRPGRPDDFGSPVASQGAAGLSGTGRAGAVQGGAGPTGTGVAGAVQGSAGHPGTGGPGAVQGGAGLPGSGPGAWQGGFHRPEHTGPHGAPQAGAQDHPGSPAHSPSGPAQPGVSGPYYAPPGSVSAAPRPPRGRGKVVAGVAALVLAVGGVAGGVGGYVGFQAAEDARPVTNALNQTPPAQQSSDAPAGSTEQVAQKVLPTVVQVQVNGGAGSGFTLSSDGLVLTNNHVVESAAGGGPIKVQLQDGRSFDAKIVGRDPTSDLAVVKVEDVSGLPTAELGNSGDLRIGQQVVAVGSPFDLNGTVTSGIVSSLNRPVRAGGQQGGVDTVLNAIQTDAAINPGNSGGPLVNMRGQVVGINSAIYSPNSSQSSQGGSVGIGFAIPIDQARRTAKELSETGKANQTVLGVQVGDAPEGGAVVRDVTAGGAAAAAGVKSGDVITKFGDRPIDTSDSLVAAVRSRAPGEKVQLTIGGNRTVEVTLGSQPVEVR
ncbi:putative serine protease PepD [Saccharothrix texasensis]|uniref:Putative serine protease PepD n=1 Tax=Saccharothrix texasensis TaxID=103734 RepID=A0A3N1H821_9PSEU|nr:putative serine protease PepD [Saccharothrix texasensis]